MSANETTNQEQAALLHSASSAGDTVEREDGMGWTNLATASEEEEMVEPSENQDLSVPPTVVVPSTGTGNENEDSFSPMLKATKAGLDAMNLSYNVHPENDDDVTAITFTANLSDARNVSIRILIKEASGLFILMLNLPTLVPEEHRTNISKYWTHVNYNLNVGNFEMDFRDGEVRFRMAAVFKNAQLSPEMVTDSVQAAANMATLYLPGQFHVIYGDKDFEKAYQIARSNA